MYGQPTSKSSRHKSGSKGTSPGGDGSFLSPNLHRSKAGYSTSGSPADSMQSGSPSGSLSGHSHTMSPLPGDMTSSPVPSPSSKSPYQSPCHSRSSSLSSVRSSLRDREGTRSLERGLAANLHKTENELTVHQHTSLINSPRHGASIRDRSLDRQLQREREAERYHTYSGHGKDRYQERDRDYPHMGAKSLERDYPPSNLVRSRSIDYDYVNSQAAFLPQSMDFRSSDTLILDLQTKIAELNKECAMLQQDVDHTKDKLASSMNSIKTFWSPELKKERALRKEESVKFFTICEQAKLLQAENRKQSHVIGELQSQLHSIHNGSELSYDRAGLLATTSMLQDQERHNKEVLILRKTITEMELRIDTQKQTLCAREESIKKLLSMVQNKDAVFKNLEEDHREKEQLRVKVAESDLRIKQLEGQLEQRENMLKQAKQSLDSNTSQKCTEYEDVIKTKNVQVEALQVKIQNLQEAVQTKREQNTSMQSNADHLQDQVLKMNEHSKSLQAKCEDMGKELSEKARHVQALEASLKNVEKRTAETDQNTKTLQEQLGARSTDASVLQSQLQKLQHRLDEVKTELELESGKVTRLGTQKEQLETQLRQEITTQEVKDKQIDAQQKRIDMLEVNIRDLESTLSSANMKISTVQHDSKSNEATVSQMKEMLEKQKLIIDRLNDEKSQKEKELQNELKNKSQSSRDYSAKIQELQKRLEQTQLEYKSARDTMTQLQDAVQKQSATIDRLNEEKTEKDRDLQNELKNKSQSSREYSIKLQELQKRLEQTQLENKSAGVTVSQLQDALQTQSLTIERLNEEKIRNEKDLQNELKNMSQNSREYNLQVQDLQKQLEQSQLENKSIGVTVTQLQDTLQKQKGDIERMHHERNQRESSLQKEMKNQYQNIQELNTANQQLQKQLHQIQQEAKSSDITVSHLKETLQKQKTSIEKLNDEKKKNEAELGKELKSQNQTSRELHNRVKQLQKELEHGQAEHRQLREQAEAAAEASHREITGLKEDITRTTKESTRAQCETDRLLNILEQSELEKMEMDKTMKDLQDQVKQYKLKVGPLQNLKDDSSKGSKDLKFVVAQRDERIEELEEALRESVKITAQRELVMAQQQDHIDLAEKQMEYLNEELEKLQEQGSGHTQHVTDLQHQIDARDKQLKLLQGDRGKQLSELYEMKQEALSAAITEKDAHIALLEIAPNRKTENIDAVERLTKEKIFLQHQLKDLTEKRMKLLSLGTTNGSNS